MTALKVIHIIKLKFYRNIQSKIFIILNILASLLTLWILQHVLFCHYL